MDITLGLGECRAPTSADLGTIVKVSSTTVSATTDAIPFVNNLDVVRNGSVLGAMVDAALASLVSATPGGIGDDPDPTVQPVAPAGIVRLDSVFVVNPRKKRGQSSHFVHPYPHRIPTLFSAMTGLLSPKKSSRAEPAAVARRSQ